ncbi:hypothetical protein GGE16_002655 [Rhizobium leguminosarum]|uniref:Uncharacterized protein n=1 Tax=Rhizobium leguminosarum TaxID=384 RepID=A0AAE2MJZ8_RHILE|nr:MULTISPECIES: hypothetical protein [Rhizobium]MBB4290615.1 hypothetical protein [Rhizobium leguminosarum]MBB4297320.1 hypothetical protein [Rhizobium leguminosarum]MBB4307480.1 hypothetical protein [Rhizobium leguminosarum]MBB4415254.1 hypothetical protein [Rhizobium leguminosarum]MBB4431779.1 hypothetical protein [Rhizobium esperanzae]
MPYVTRNDDGEIAGLFEQPQEGYGEEFLPDDAAEVVEFSAKANAVLADLREKLKKDWL